jgi:hypothetical protein
MSNGNCKSIENKSESESKGKGQGKGKRKSNCKSKSLIRSKVSRPPKRLVSFTIFCKGSRPTELRDYEHPCISRCYQPPL